MIVKLALNGMGLIVGIGGLLLLSLLVWFAQVQDKLRTYGIL